MFMQFSLDFCCLFILLLLIIFFFLLQSCNNPTGNYMFKFNNTNTRARCEICSKLTIETPKRLHWCEERRAKTCSTYIFEMHRFSGYKSSLFFHTKLDQNNENIFVYSSTSPRKCWNLKRVLERPGKSWNFAEISEKS